MTGDEALRALERVLVARGATFKRAATLDDIRAALASKDAGPQPDTELQALRAELDEAIPTVEVLVDELARLRAWEKWGREVAKLPLSCLPPPPQDPQGGVR